MASGPVDILILGFPVNDFTGRIASAVMDLVETGTIRVLDLLFVTKDADGATTTVDMRDLDPETGPAFLELTVHAPGALGAEDAEEIADDLPANSSALMIAFENTWASTFVEAARAAGAVVIDQIRIPSDVVDAALAGS